MLNSAEEESYLKVRERVDRICHRASETGIPVMIDAEESWLQNPIDQIAFEMMARYNQTKALVFITYQMYRTDSMTNLKDAFHRAAMHNYFLGVKLVRGAYMEKERSVRLSVATSARYSIPRRRPIRPSTRPWSLHGQ